MKKPPTKLSEWPDELPWPEEGYLKRCGVDGPCISMYCGKVLGHPEWKRGMVNPSKLLEALGVPTDIASMAIYKNDGVLNKRSDPDGAFEYLMEQLGYECVTE